MGIRSWPQPESARLSAASAAFERRRKAIENKGDSFAVSREIEEIDEAIFQRLNVDFRGIRSRASRAQLRLSIWSDGSAWIGAHRGSKRGWEFAFTADMDVRLAAPAELVEKYEATILQLNFVVGAVGMRTIEEVWAQHLWGFRAEGD